MVDPASALAAAKEIDHALGLIEKLLGKLRAKPDIAALKLSAALDEIVKTYRAVDEAFTTYVSLALDDGALRAGARQLLAIAGGNLSVRVSEGGGHCHVIGNIYDKHLKRWFEKVFNGDEQQQMSIVFRRFNDVDGDLFYKLADLARQMEEDATTVLRLVMAGDDQGARQQVLQTYTTLVPLQQEMGRGMQRMFKLKNDFIQVAQTV